MIDYKMFDLQKLVNTMLDTEHGHRNKWWDQVEIIKDWMPPYPRDDTRPICVIACKYKHGMSYLRHSKGPRQGHSWDIYPDNYLTPELALLAVLEAPIPPWYIKESAYNYTES